MLKEFTLAVPGINPFTDLLSEYDCRATVVDCRYFDEDVMGVLAEFEGERIDELCAALRANGVIKRIYMTQSEERRALAMMIMRTPLCCRAAQVSSAICISCAFNSPGTASSWKLLVRDTGNIRKLLQLLEKNDFSPKITEVSNASHNNLVTSRQHEMLREAINRGYYEFPRRTSLTELAKILSLKPSTLSEILRRAEGKLIKRYMNELHTSFNKSANLIGLGRTPSY